jgi:hypothetical protein
MKMNMDSIDLFPNVFLLAFITPLSIVALRSLRFSIFDASRFGYANRSTTEGRPNKKCTRVAVRAFPQIKVFWRQPGDCGRYPL